MLAVELAVVGIVDPEGKKHLSPVGIVALHEAGNVPSQLAIKPVKVDQVVAGKSL